MEKRLATLSIFLYSRDSVDQVNNTLKSYSELIVSRMGIPYRERQISVIVIILDGDTDKIGALSGKLGNLPGVSVKTAISKI